MEVRKVVEVVEMVMVVEAGEVVAVVEVLAVKVAEMLVVVGKVVDGVGVEVVV